jgi:CDP-paratose 2-epimerase
VRILITGGAGFVGSSLAYAFCGNEPGNEITILDNLRRRGSELNLAKFKKLGIRFLHGDIRNASDLADLSGNFDVFIEASAEPSVLAGLEGSPSYVLNTNLGGTLNCLEFARLRAGLFIFLSTSRVYSIEPLRSLRFKEGSTRLEILPEQKCAGVSVNGVAEEFPTNLPRSFYGASKLASELIIQEYSNSYGLRAAINRCGVLAGPGQFGKVDQGVFTLWVANHFFKMPLRYTGFGGTGKQVRDLLHPRDLFALIRKQLDRADKLPMDPINIGGGPEVSVSLAELTMICQEITGNTVPIGQDLTSSAVDIPWYVTDSEKAGRLFDWKPTIGAKQIVHEIVQWLHENESALRPLFTNG